MHVRYENNDPITYLPRPVIVSLILMNYSGRKITESLGNVTVRGGKDGKSKGGARWRSLSEHV
jgi:hypothetical protein